MLQKICADGHLPLTGITYFASSFFLSSFDVGAQSTFVTLGAKMTLTFEPWNTYPYTCSLKC